MLALTWDDCSVDLCRMLCWIICHISENLIPLGAVKNIWNTNIRDLLKTEMHVGKN